MSIADDIKKTIQSRIVIRYCTEETLQKPDVTCVLCGCQFTIQTAMCLYIRGEGHICPKCSERYAPEMTRLMAFTGDSLYNVRNTKVNFALTEQEWREIRFHCDELLKLTIELSRGISRGIVESPTGHIGLLHLAKDIGKPVRKDNESDKDYDLRLKSHRMVHLFDKIKGETWGRVNSLLHYFNKLGMPQNLEKSEKESD